ncbi:MAG: acyl carrier protein [Clostridia bacterium]|nr:acyl carrier protein [Clostridia bacterium]
MITIEILKELFETIFGQELNLDGISESSDLRKDIGMNSISFLYMAMVMEEKYGIKFNNDDFEKIATVKDVMETVESKVQSR